MSATLSKEMQQHTYEIMNRVEDKHWWFVGRRAILESFLEQITSGFESRLPAATADEKPAKAGTQNAIKILDVGCGTGANLEMLANFGKPEGVDVSDDALEFCRQKGLKVHKGLAEKLPFEHESFDLVTALDVVEHLDDDIAGLKEMNRVMKNSGRALIFVPAFMWLWGVQDDVSNHRIRYTKKPNCRKIENLQVLKLNARLMLIGRFSRRS